MKKQLFRLLLAALLMPFWAEAQPHGNLPVKNLFAPRHKVLIQVSTADTLVHAALMHQLSNLIQHWKDSVSIEVLVHGPGIELMQRPKSTQQEAIRSLRQRQVRWVVCEFTMQQRKVKKEEIIEGADFVPFGLVALVTRQEEGWTYLKAGF